MNEIGNQISQGLARPLNGAVYSNLLLLPAKIGNNMEIISRKEAVENNLKYYFTGVPCKHGHISRMRVIGYQCKTCRNRSNAKRVNKNSELKNRLRQRYRLKYPKRRQAELQVQRAVKKGFLKKQPCEICGNIKSEGHHPDYSKPLEVIWLCSEHHNEVHLPSKKVWGECVDTCIFFRN